MQVEEVILRDVDVYDVNDNLRLESRASELTLTINDSRNQDSTWSVLEAAIVYEMPPDGSTLGHQSDIARDILTKYGPFLAPSAPWEFSPTSELDLLVSREVIVEAQVESRSSPPNEPADGEAIIFTPEGAIVVFQRAGYLRLAWNLTPTP